MNQTLQAVLDYLDTPRTDFAFLIDGPWGSGKSHFWKNSVVPVLTALPAPKRPNRVLYASFYGVTNVNEIDRALFAQSYPGISRKRVGTGSRLLSSAIEALGVVDFAKIDLRTLVRTSNSVICFDDVERANLPMKVLLGYINTFVEHDQSKVIMLCNEGAITDDDDRLVYLKMKEKLVGACQVFRPDLDTVFSNLIEEHEDRPEFHGFLSENAPLLRSIFDSSKTNNIRALRRAIASLAVVTSALRSARIELKLLAKQLMYAIAPASFDIHGRAANPEHIRAILSRSHLVTASVSFSNSGRELTETEKYEAEFVDRYLRDNPGVDWYDAVGCMPICEFILTGVLDRTSLVEWARKLTTPLDAREARIQKLTGDYRDLEDDDFANVTAEVLKEVSSGQYESAGRYVSLFEIFAYFADSGLIPQTREDISREFNNGLDKAVESKRLKGMPELRDNLDHPAMIPKSDDGQRLLRRALAANDDLLNAANGQRVREIAQCRANDPGKFIDALWQHDKGGFLFRPVFQELGPADMAKWIRSLPNALKIHFEYALQARYEKHGPRPDCGVELPVLKEITNILKADAAQRANPKPTKISEVLVVRIIAQLDRAIENVSRALQPAAG